MKGNARLGRVPGKGTHRGNQRYHYKQFPYQTFLAAARNGAMRLAPGLARRVSSSASL